MLEPELRLILLQRSEKLNALNRPLLTRLTQQLREADAEPRVRGVLLAGEGRAFSAGVDLREFAEPSEGPPLIEVLRELCATVRALSKPVACAIQGHCLGGALELAACCDFRVSTPDARLGMPEVLIGIPSVIDAVMLVQHVGAGRAYEMLLTGEAISGETAHAWGLVNRLAPAEQVIDAAADLLRLVTRHAPEVVAAQKRLHQQWLDLPYSEAVRRSVQALLEASASGRPAHIASERLRS